MESMLPGQVCDLHEVKGKQDSVVVIRIGQHNLVLQFGPQKVVEFSDCNVGQLGGAPEQLPGKVVDTVVSRRRGVLVRAVNRIEAEWSVVEERALVFPAGKVMECLEDNAVDMNVAVGELLVKSAVVVL